MDFEEQEDGIDDNSQRSAAENSEASNIGVSGEAAVASTSSEKMNVVLMEMESTNKEKSAPQEGDSDDDKNEEENSLSDSSQPCTSSKAINLNHAKADEKSHKVQGGMAEKNVCKSDGTEQGRALSENAHQLEMDNVPSTTNAASNGTTVTTGEEEPLRALIFFSNTDGENMEDRVEGQGAAARENGTDESQQLDIAEMRTVDVANLQDNMFYENDELENENNENNVFGELAYVVEDANGAQNNAMVEDSPASVSNYYEEIMTVSSSNSSSEEPWPQPSLREENIGGGWSLAPDHVQAAIHELIAQGRSAEGAGGGMASLLHRDYFMQRLRRVIFSLDHNRQRNRGNNSENVEGPSNMESENTAENEGGNHLDTGIEIDETIDDEPENPIRFDTNLPAEHSYLGGNMHRVSGVNYLDAGQSFEIMLFKHQHILFPGEVLPFMISGSLIDPNVDGQNGILFGVCFPNLGNSEQDEMIYGVTCQIYEKGSDTRGNTLIKSRTLQRFITKKNDIKGYLYPLEYIANHPVLKCTGFVHILPEIYLPEPLRCIDMGSMQRFRDNPSMQNVYKLYQAATTPFPVHVFEYYSMSAVVEKARSQLAQHKIDTMPTDPIQLSFWLVRNLHMSEAMMKTIFTTDSVNIRMKMIASTFKEESIFICRYCGNKIANCRELFAMSKHGVQTQYCNSAGYIHETNTVYQLIRNAISYSGSPSSEFSWFPGYQWQIIVCKICSRHIGWEFDAIEPNLLPKIFFGLSSASVRISSAAHVPTDPHAEIYQNILRLARREMI